jgi:hypothetical protein
LWCLTLARRELAGKLTVGRINFNEERELTERFGVTTLPTFKLYRVPPPPSARHDQRHETHNVS